MLDTGKYSMRGYSNIGPNLTKIIRITRKIINESFKLLPESTFPMPRTFYNYTQKVDEIII
jgi:hypothetical protein